MIAREEVRRVQYLNARVVSQRKPRDDAEVPPPPPFIAQNKSGFVQALAM
jgi:hypothetical protein